MPLRKCPDCGAVRYSAYGGDWRCDECGATVSREHNITERMINCEYYVPAWEGSKTSGKQPDFCLKYKVPLNGYCIKNCEVQTKLVSERRGGDADSSKVRRQE